MYIIISDIKNQTKFLIQIDNLYLHLNSKVVISRYELHN